MKRRRLHRITFALAGAYSAAEQLLAYVECGDASRRCR